MSGVKKKWGKRGNTTNHCVLIVTEDRTQPLADFVSPQSLQLVCQDKNHVNFSKPKHQSYHLFFKYTHIFFSSKLSYLPSVVRSDGTSCGLSLGGTTLSISWVGEAVSALESREMSTERLTLLSSSRSSGTALKLSGLGLTGTTGASRMIEDSWFSGISSGVVGNSATLH